MRWTERQQTLLQAMGLRLWSPPGDPALPTPGASADQAAALPWTAPATALPATAPTTAPTTAPITAPTTVQAPPATTLRPAAARPVPVVVAAPGQAPAPAPGVAPSPTDTLDWPALRAAVAGCRACGLCDSRTQTVFGVGHPHAHCMVVGEAPGEQEDARGEPFVGAAGQLLDRMLAALGLSRGDGGAPGLPAQQVFIANALKCRPPRNRNPTPQELAACRPFLQRQVALVQPRVILAMGRFAVQSLLDSDAPIGKLRGTVHRWHGVPLVVTYHPAYLLRQPADKAKAWDDLCLAAELLAQPPGR
ncbi:MAG: uracil-DNA glycosylase [Aquabacterium sp.]|nr:uracil-DNA glycosylase [Aquabacterium sp.]